MYIHDTDKYILWGFIVFQDQFKKKGYMYSLRQSDNFKKPSLNLCFSSTNGSRKDTNKFPLYFFFDLLIFK